MAEPKIPLVEGDLVRVRKSHGDKTAGCRGRVIHISPEPYDRARDAHGPRAPRGLSTRLVHVLLEGETYRNYYWPEALELIGQGVRS